MGFAFAAPAHSLILPEAAPGLNDAENAADQQGFFVCRVHSLPVNRSTSGTVGI